MFAFLAQNVRTTCTKYVHTKFQLSGHIQYLYERREIFNLLETFKIFYKMFSLVKLKSIFLGKCLEIWL